MTKPTMIALLLLPVLAMSLTMQRALGAAEAESVDGDGFVHLFNGEDLTGWKTEGNWVAQDDGTLAIIPREGEKGWQRYESYLYTEKQY
ncbi:MAG: hypothetical protein ACPGYV_15110, partial [Phycisphaeraceae bacterium]